ncbi:MAG: hypothetical protein ACFFBP_13635 [Promethearchaeota archaeon]
MKIAIDVVGVLLDNIEIFIKIYNETFKTQHVKEDIKRWDFYEELNLTAEEFITFFYKTMEHPEEIPFIDDDALIYMEKLNKMHEVHILSALDSKCRNSLEKQLELHDLKKDIHYKEMIVVPETPYDVKLTYEYHVYVDDNPNLVEPIKKLKDRFLLLFNQPWNQDSTCEHNVIRVYNWKEIFKIIQNIEITT